MSKPKQWRQVREMKHADVWISPESVGLPSYPTGDVVASCVCGSWPGSSCLRCRVVLTGAYPQEAEPDGRLWVGSGDSQ